MFTKIKERLTKAVSWFDDLLFYEEPEDNTYCIPCTWTFSGRVYVSAPDVESAKVYVQTHKITPELEECLCYNTTPDTNHPILCICGNCNKEYVVSPLHNPLHCPHCGNGGDM